MIFSAAASARARPGRISLPIALGVIVFGASAVHALLALQIASPWIVPDEIRYAELAKSLGDGKLPAIRDEVTFAFGLGYPLLLAPIWALFEDVAVAYTAAKVLNSVLLGLTAVPAYFLARRFVGERSALVVAALSVSIPSLLYAGMLMTEVALYPAFVLALFAIAVALERPTPATQLAALGAVALASMVKVLAVSLLFGYLAAVLLFHRLDTRRRKQWFDRLCVYWPTWFALTTIAVFGFGLGAAVGRRPTAVLGTYEPFLNSVDVRALPSWMFFHVAAFDFFVAVIPFAATALVIVAGLRRDADRRVRLLAVMSVAMSAPVFAAVAAYSSNPSPSVFGYASGAGANERATFVLAPLVLIGLMVWLRDRPGSRLAVVAVALGAAVLPAAVPLDRFAENVVKVQAFSLIPWVEAPHITHGRASLLVASLALGGIFLSLALVRARDVAFVAPVAAAFIAATMVAQTFIEITSEWTRLVGVGGSPSWVDRAVQRESVSVLWYERPGRPWVPLAPRHRIVWLSEFYNRNIGSVYELGSPMPYGIDLPSTRVRLAGRLVVLDDGRPAAMGRFVLAPCYVHVDGEPVARNTATGAAVYRVRGAVRATVSEPRECGAGAE